MAEEAGPLVCHMVRVPPIPSLTITDMNVGLAGGGSGMNGVLQAGKASTSETDPASSVTATWSHRLGVMSRFLRPPWEQGSRQAPTQAQPHRAASGRQHGWR